MSAAHVIALLLTYKYALLYPLAILEGHLISLISGFLARGGYLNPFIAGVIIMSGNITGDILLYWLGYRHGETTLLKWGHFLGITEASIAKSKTLFATHPKKILFLSKLTNGFGLQIAVLFTAGLSRINFRTYMIFNILGEAVWTGSLTTLGYFLGQFYTLADTAISRIGLGVGILVFLFVAFRIHRSFFNRTSS